MRNHLLHTTALALMLAGGAGLAAAQSQTQQPEAKDPARVAPAENVQHTPQTGPALVDGALAAPQADKNSATVPAKFSAKNDAEDHLPLVAFTFKHLSDEQRRAIVASVKDAATAPLQGGASPELYAHPSVRLPGTVDLHALPDAVTASIPQTEAYRYATAGDKVLLVEPANRTVVAVIEE